MSTTPDKPWAPSVWLPWLVGGAAAGIAIVAFALWGLNGPAYLLDLVAAYCF